MTEQEKARKAAELLTAWADGKKLEYFRCSSNSWIDYASKRQPMIFDDGVDCWRIKPEPVKQWYRVALFRSGATRKMKYRAFIANDHDAEFCFEKDFDFIKWLTDRIEYELPNE